MSSKHLIDPQLLPALALMPDLELSVQALPAIRAALAAALPAPAEGARVDERFVPGPPGAPDVRVLVYAPADSRAARPALLHIHGGGYVLGRPEWNDASNRALVDLLGCVVVSVDYRLAPEHPHPAPLEDCYAALKWLAGAGHDLRVDASRIAITGESAGGGLAAALALVARDRGEVGIAFQLLDCPMIDDRTAARDQALPFVGEFVWTHAKNRFGWLCLLGREPGGVDVPPHAAAAQAEQLAGLPATCITIGALDLFLDENLAFAGRLAHAGVPIELHVYPGAFHGFNGLSDAPVARRCRSDGVEALRRAFELSQDETRGHTPPVLHAATTG